MNRCTAEMRRGLSCHAMITGLSTPKPKAGTDAIIGHPWRVASHCRQMADLRGTSYGKLNPMPGVVRDRPTRRTSTSSCSDLVPPLLHDQMQQEASRRRKNTTTKWVRVGDRPEIISGRDITSRPATWFEQPALKQTVLSGHWAGPRSTITGSNRGVLDNRAGGHTRGPHALSPKVVEPCILAGLGHGGLSACGAPWSARPTTVYPPRGCKSERGVRCAPDKR